MPKIEEATVKEHRERITNDLIAAASDILRSEDGVLTAAAVSKRAGIARNSIYRYVSSVNELKRLVIDQHMPQWTAALEESMEGLDDPRDRIHAWVRINLEQSALHGHGWLMRLMMQDLSSEQSQDHLKWMYRALDGMLRQPWNALSPEHADMGIAITNSLTLTGMQLLDANPENQRIVDDMVNAVDAIMERFAAHEQ